MSASGRARNSDDQAQWQNEIFLFISQTARDFSPNICNLLLLRELISGRAPGRAHAGKVIVGNPCDRAGSCRLGQAGLRARTSITGAAKKARKIAQAVTATKLLSSVTTENLKTA